jgi:hypothetical protein
MAISAIFGIAWVIAAWARPEVNYVLFPLLIAGSLPVIYRLGMRRPIAVSFAVAAAIAGAFNAVLLAAFLSISGSLLGPTLLGFGGPVLDAAIWAVAGAALGVVAASWAGPRRSG